MSTNRFLTMIGGVWRLVTAIATSIGAADADKIPATSSNGKLHNSLINWDAPGAIGTTTSSTIAATTITSTGNITSTGTRIGLTPPSAPPGGGFRYDFTAGASVGFVTVGPSSNFQISHGAAGAAAVGLTNSGGSLALQWDAAAQSAGGNVLLGTGTNNGSDRLQVAGNGNFAGFIRCTAVTTALSLVGAVRSTFRNLNPTGVRQSDLAILTGNGNEGLFIGTMNGNLAYIDNQTTGPFVFYQAGVPGALTINSNSVQVNGALNVSGLAGLTTLRVGANGSVLSRINTATSTSFNNVVVGENATTTTTLAIAGITTSDIVCVSKISAANPNFDVDGFVSALGTVTVTLYNRSASSQTFSGSIRAIVFG